MQNYKICPYCGQTLQAGWMQSRDGLHWTPGRTFAAVLSGLTKRAVRLENHHIGSNTAAHAYHCPKCRVVIVPYDRFDLE